MLIGVSVCLVNLHGHLPFKSTSDLCLSAQWCKESFYLYGAIRFFGGLRNYAPVLLSQFPFSTRNLVMISWLASCNNEVQSFVSADCLRHQCLMNCTIMNCSIMDFLWHRRMHVLCLQEALANNATVVGLCVQVTVSKICSCFLPQLTRDPGGCHAVYTQDVDSWGYGSVLDYTSIGTAALLRTVHCRNKTNHAYT